MAKDGKKSSSSESRTSIFRLSDACKDVKYNKNDFLNSGSKSINDLLTGDKDCGYPKGRVTEIFGPEGSFKTTLCLHASVECNKNDEEVLYMDTEHGLNIHYAKQIGVNPELFLLSQPDCGEEAFEIAFEQIENNKKLGLVVFDSVASIVPRAEIEGSMDDHQMGAHARLMGRGLRKLVSKIKKANVPVLFINQTRSKIGGYGNPTTTTGGNALKFYSFVRIEVRTPRGGKIIGKGSLEDIVKSDKDEIGIEMNMHTLKNKLYMPYKECSINMLYGKGLDKEDDLIRYLDSKGVIGIEGGKINVNGKTMLRKSFITSFANDKEFKNKILKGLNSEK